MGLYEIEKKIDELKSNLATENERHKKEVNYIQKELNEVKRQKSILMSNINLDQVKLAENVLKIDGEFNKVCVLDAINDIVSDKLALRTEYFGAKNYEGWRHQRVDCNYGYGPRHGYVVFRVEFKSPYRGKDAQLTIEEKDACLYYLNLLLDESTRRVILA